MLHKLIIAFLFFIYINLNAQELISIQSINFDGNTSYLSKKEVIDLLKDETTYVFTPDYLILNHFKTIDLKKVKVKECKNIIKEYIEEKGYFNSNVHCEVNDDVLNITINDAKQYIISTINIINEQKEINIDINEMCNNLNITNTKECFKEGNIFTTHMETSFQKYALDILEEQNNYILNEITYQPTFNNETNTVSIDITIKPNEEVFIGTITFDSDDTLINRKLIEKLLTFKEGDKFSYGIIRESIKNIKNTNAIEQIFIIPQFKDIIFSKFDNKAMIPLIVKIKPKTLTKKITMRLGYDTYEGIKAASTWENVLVNKEMLQIKTSLELSQKKQEAIASLSIPNIIEVNKNLTINLFQDKNTSLESMFTNFDFHTKIGYEREEYIGNQKIQSLYNDTYLTTQWFNIKELETNIGTRIILDTPTNSNKDIEIDIFEFSSHLITSYYFNIIYEQVDNKLFTKQGQKYFLEIEHSNPKQFTDYEFMITTLRFQNFYQFYNKEFILATLIEHQYINSLNNETIPEIKKLVSGGYTTNRGYSLNGIYSINEDITQTKITFNNEIRWMLEQEKYLYLFNDFTRLNSKDFNSYGLGLYWTTPIGVISLGGALNKDNNYKIFFNIGTSF